MSFSLDTHYCCPILSNPSKASFSNSFRRKAIHANTPELGCRDVTFAGHFPKIARPAMLQISRFAIFMSLPSVVSIAQVQYALPRVKGFRSQHRLDRNMSLSPLITEDFEIVAIKNEMSARAKWQSVTTITYISLNLERHRSRVSKQRLY